MWERMFDDLIARVSGPMHFRLLMQPLVALFFGIRDGLKDAREGRPAYFWRLFYMREGRWESIKSGLKAVTNVLIFAIVLDAIYQIIELRWFYPGEAVIVALLLAFVPYLLIRGPANRIAKWWASRHSSTLKTANPKT